MGEPWSETDEFWSWCFDNGYHDKDYVLDNLAELEEQFLEELEWM